MSAAAKSSEALRNARQPSATRAVVASNCRMENRGIGPPVLGPELILADVPPIGTFVSIANGCNSNRRQQRKRRGGLADNHAGFAGTSLLPSFSSVQNLFVPITEVVFRPFLTECQRASQ